MSAMDNMELAAAYLPDAIRLAPLVKRNLGLHVELADLESEAVWGMLKAARRYDPDRNAAFATYVSMRAIGAMRDYVEQKAMQPWRWRPLKHLGDREFIEIDFTDYSVLHRAFAKLPRKWQIVMRLRYVGGWPHWRIGKFMGWTTGHGYTCPRSWQIERAALAKLRMYLERKRVTKVSDVI